ncbi:MULTISPECIES: antitoxin VbhA family protein [Psychrilyobacter]|nr:MULTISPECIES: antitoxin VbhA family protein [Psychrilyobacter]MCS5422032.1 antitoxin VbhA family protein [Psychrilyobacter sp. S5]NDI76350.1 antitoxin VbhA family protein [Psychrilyobacter piezotolerans]
MNSKEADRAVRRVKATMEIEGFELSKRDLITLKEVAMGKLSSDLLIKEYKERVSNLTGNATYEY